MCLVQRITAALAQQIAQYAVLLVPDAGSFVRRTEPNQVLSSHFITRKTILVDYFYYRFHRRLDVGVFVLPYSRGRDLHL